MIIILIFIIKNILSANPNYIYSLKNKDKLAIRPISGNNFIIFHEEKTIIKTYNVANEQDLNSLFNFKGTFYPLFYNIDNNNYYIVSPENSNPNKLKIYKGEIINTFNDFKFSKLNILTPLNNHQFIASYSNSTTDKKCLISCFDFNDNSITTTDFSSLCTSSDDNEFLNIYNINNNYIYMHYVSGKIESGSISLSSTKNFNIVSNISQTLDNSDCQVVSQLQVVNIDNSITKVCFYNPSNFKVCCATGIYENNEYKLGEFVSNLECKDTGYFSLYKLTDNLSIVGCAGSTSEHLKYNIYNNDNKLKGDGKIICHPSKQHYMKDFAVNENGNIYLLAYHSGCSYHEYYIQKNQYEVCTDKNEIIKIINEGEKEANIISKYFSIPTSIVIRDTDCGSNLKSNTDDDIAKDSTYDVNDIYAIQNYGIQCSMEYYKKYYDTNILYTFKIFCTLNLVSCDNKCSECNQLSESKEKMNCKSCNSLYIFTPYSSSDPNNGNCCTIPNCMSYNLNCNCIVSDSTISVNINEEKNIEIHSLTTNQKIQIKKNTNFYGDFSFSDSGIDTNSNEFNINYGQIIYKSDKVGEYSFDYSLYENNVLISNSATITIQVCKSGCTCGNSSITYQYECISCSIGTCNDIKVKNITKIITTYDNLIKINENIDVIGSISSKFLYINFQDNFKGKLDDKMENFETSNLELIYNKDPSIPYGIFYFQYKFIDSSTKIDQSNIGNVTLIICEDYCECEINNDGVFNYCTQCLTGTYSYINKFGELKCYETCPNTLDVDTTLFICKDKIECVKGYKLNKNKDGCELEEISILIELMDDISILIANLNQKLEDDKYILEVYYSNKLFNYNSSISNINFSQCETILKENGIISEYESLIITKLDILQTDSITREVQYQIYTENGEKIDLEYCKNINIEITYPIDEPNLINFEKGKEMYEEGIDIYNISDPFFNDICYPYSINGKDIILEDRRKTIYQNINICKDNCNYNKINYEKYTVSCYCDTSYNYFDLSRTNTEKNKVNIKTLFSNKFKNLNVNILKCFHLIMNFNNLIYNIGFVFGGFINISELIMIFILTYYGYDSVISKIYTNMKVNEVTNQFLLKKNTNLENSKYSNSNNNIMNKLIKSNSLIEIVFQKDLYENLPYDIAINKDKRNFNKIFKHNFMEKHPIFRIFKKSIFELMNLNIIIYLSHLEIMFSIDGILYSTSQISKDFHGLLKYYIPLLYSFYSYILGTLILHLFKYLISYTKVLDTYVKEIKNNDILVKMIMKYMKKIKIKIIIFLIFNFLISIFFWYYMTIFCIIYNHTQIKWFIRGWISFFYSFIYCLIFSFIFTIFRYLSLKLQMKFLYNISLYIKKIL